MRIDKWLWCLRVYRSRSLASEACRSGHVHVASVAAKPAYETKVGDLISARNGDRVRILTVIDFPPNRVAASLVGKHAIDLPPKPDPTAVPNINGISPRLKGTGRPTKKQRREWQVWDENY